MYKIIVFGTLLVMPLLAHAGGAGYGNTKWDMRPSEVVAAQGNGAHLIAPEKYKGSVGKVRIDKVDIGSGLYNVNFLFDDSDRLVQTNVTSVEQMGDAANLLI